MVNTTSPPELLKDNYTDIDKPELIQRLNDDMARLMTPATVYISVLMVLGLFGNSIVCYYYTFKIKRTVSSLFIVILAVYDVIVCAVSMPTEIVDIVLFYTFENSPACKILRFVNYLAGIGSILTLIAIATDRYKKICKAVRPQMTVQRAKTIAVIIFPTSILLSWPSLLIYGSIKVNIPNDLGIDLLGSDCTSTKEQSYRKYVWSFNVVHFVLFFICSVTLIVLYSIIGKTIYVHRKRLMKYKRPHTSIKVSTEEISLSTTPSSKVEEEVATSKQEDTKVECKGKAIVTKEATHVSKRIQDTSTQKTTDSSHCPQINRKTEHINKGAIDNETIKLTFIMITVTTVFIISFLPYLSLTVWRIYQGQHEAEFLSGGGLVGFKIGSRSFLLNSSLNPWIYGIFNTNFRRFVLRPCLKQ